MTTLRDVLADETVREARAKLEAAHEERREAEALVRETYEACDEASEALSRAIKDAWQQGPDNVYLAKYNGAWVGRSYDR